MALTKSELIERIVAKQALLTAKDVELAVKTIVEQMSETLSSGGRIEIRGLVAFLCITESLASAVIPKQARR
jgi:integration host factor subunit beta